MLVNRLIIELEKPEDKRHISKAIRNILASSTNFSKDLVNASEIVIFKIKHGHCSISSD